MIEIPPDCLDEELLVAIIEAYVLREGTDYGESEMSLEDKVAQVKRQIRQGNVIILFDDVSETCNLMRREEFKE